MPFANFKVPVGTLTAEQKELIVHRTTDLYAEIYGEQAHPTRWSSSTRWSTAVGIGDHVLTAAILRNHD